MSLSTAYAAIVEYYGARVATRSQVPLINHIDEGLVVLRELQVDESTQAAYCLHPMIQDDGALFNNLSTLVEQTDRQTLVYVMEYRNIANAGLRAHVDRGMMPQLSPLKAVNDMLIADKVQNCKDFYTYHRATHPESDSLVAYFETWFDVLGISNRQYLHCCGLIDEFKATRPVRSHQA